MTSSVPYYYPDNQKKNEYEDLDIEDDLEMKGD